MEQLDTKQTENIAQATAVDGIDGVQKQDLQFGKFKDVESLQKAYSSLEQEFTRRSQKLRELEGERLELIKSLETKSNSFDSNGYSLEDEGGVDGFFRDYPSARSVIKELTEIAIERQSSGKDSRLDKAYIEYLEKTIENYSKNIADENFLLSHIEGTPIKGKIIKEYLTDIINLKKPTKFIGGSGEIALAPPKKPKNLEEAGNMAKSIFRKNQ